MNKIILFSIPVLILFSSSNAFAVNFVDHTGYIPDWAQSMGQNQATSTCINIDYNTKDSDWCIEFSGYVLDKLTGTTQNVTFKDHTGYIPDWAQSMGQNQATSTCINIDYNTKDSDWCIEFSGYVLDKLMGNFRGTNPPEESSIEQTEPETQIDPPSLQLDVGPSVDSVQKIPDWVQNTFKWYADGLVSETELINSLKYLIQNKIIVIDTIQEQNSDALLKEIKHLKEENTKLQNEINQLKASTDSLSLETSSSFSGVTCSQDRWGVNFNGKFTNDGNPYGTIYLTFAVLDENGFVLATGIDSIRDVEPFETRIFGGDVNYDGDYDTCHVEIKSKYR